MCIRKLVPRQIMNRLLFIEIMIAAVMIYMATGFAKAQSQDYLNGQFNEQIKALAARVNNIEDILKYIATGVFGTLGVTLWRTILDVQRERGRQEREGA